MTKADLENRFTYHPPVDHQQKMTYQTLRDAGHSLAKMIVEKTPESREQSIAITKLEEAIFWANAGIARGNP